MAIQQQWIKPNKINVHRVLPHGWKSKQEAHNRKEINKTEVEALSHGNQALVKNLRSEIEKLVKVNEAKTEELNSLYA